MALLETRKLNKRFGGLQVTADVDFAIEVGELHCLIGPNGAGKSTFFRLILGEHRPSSGEIVYAGEDITRLESHDRIRRGISVKFQVPGIFKALSVAQNLEIALQHHLEGQSLSGEIRRQLAFLNLAADADQMAGNLSHGQKQWLEIGMLLAQEPKLLLVDEPVAGMTDVETETTAHVLREINRTHSVVVVEHDMNFVRALGVKVTVLHEGSMLAEGSIDQVSADPRVVEVYLGR